jgi:hypothetical protein
MSNATPRVGRPELPAGYGVEEKGPYLEWQLIEERLIAATVYWLASVRPDGRPHVVPRWGVWLDGKFWYDGSPATRHSQNVEVNPACALHLESGTTVTIVEGTSVRSDPISGDLGVRLAAEYSRKYKDLSYEPAADAWSDEIAGGMRIVVPLKAIAWSQFPTDLTRFVFD